MPQARPDPALRTRQRSLPLSACRITRPDLFAHPSGYSLLGSGSANLGTAIADHHLAALTSGDQRWRFAWEISLAPEPNARLSSAPDAACRLDGTPRMSASGLADNSLATATLRSYGKACVSSLMLPNGRRRSRSVASMSPMRQRFSAAGIPWRLTSVGTTASRGSSVWASCTADWW